NNKRKYSLIKEGITEVMSELGLKPTSQNIKDCQQFDFLTGKTVLTENQRYFIFQANPDLNIGHKKLTGFFDYSSRGSFSYKKRKLAELGLIEVKSRQLTAREEYRERMKSTKSRESILGEAFYSRPLKTVVLNLCDSITINPQTQWRTAPPTHAEKI
ncbi:MAG: hypothetical protein PSX42_11210, partial [bacterium]|nr:hypothetical protein [bacterium]